METESFQLDHRFVQAPYVRKALTMQKGGQTVTKFDVRFLQPNHYAYDTTTIHSLEHILAQELHRMSDDIIDLSPMGCRTGFYLTFFCEQDTETVLSMVFDALQNVEYYEDVPANNEIQCGNYRDLDIVAAKFAAMNVLKKDWQLI